MAARRGRDGPVALRPSARLAGTAGLCLVLLLHAVTATAAQLLEQTVSERNDEYRLRVVALLDASQDYVYRVITDYQHAYRINPAITHISVEPTGRDGALLVNNRSRHRVGMFSFEVDWRGEVVQHPPGTLIVKTLPHGGSFESGLARWDIQADGDRTRVVHESVLKPGFPVVPVIGPYLIKRYMREEIVSTFARIECYARVLLERDLADDAEQVRVAVHTHQACSRAARQGGVRAEQPE